jgi:hypothetical protein
MQRHKQREGNGSGTVALRENMKKPYRKTSGVKKG